MTPTFALNPGATFALQRIGQEAQPVMVIDRVMHDALALVDCAANGEAFAPVEGVGYPGVRAAAPLAYVERLTKALDRYIREAFSLNNVAMARADCSFSIVTTPPADLAPAQCIPHVDTTYSLQFALLHYLCDGDFGGTGFYRHCLSGFETITELRSAAYAAIAAREPPPVAGYVSSGAPHYEQIAAFDAVFDRLLIYRSHALHCGVIPPAMPLVADPRRGRLTANIFLTYRTT